MYSTRPEMRAEIEKLARKHHQDNLLGKDGKIYDKAVVICNSIPVATVATRRSIVRSNITPGTA
ncbi:hypothetical protein BDV10DRAFT_165500 [Aspergillus recurvatus]